MLTLKKVAITGGLACGKSSVCRLMKNLGAYTVSADAIVHRLLSPNTELGQKVIQLLGKTIVKNGTCDRNEIAKLVFNDPDKLHKLEELLHPAVFQEIEHQYQTVSTNAVPALFVAEVPLLFEVSAEGWFDYVIVVTAPSDLCRARFKQCKGQDDEQFALRSQRQLPLSEKKRRADFIICNNGSMKDLEQQTQLIYDELIKLDFSN